MPMAVDTFITDLIASELMTAEQVRAFQEQLLPAERPESGENLARLLVRQGQLTKYQANVLFQGKGKALVLGNYAILDKLGAGGIGMVFKARHRRMERVVALKVLSAEAVKRPEAVARFHREVQAAARLDHPNIVAAFDADEAKGMHYLVMECVAGQDLAREVKDNGPLAVKPAVNYLLQAARGLAYAHAQGVIHRDIKPHNLLLDKNGTVKILDMGLARLQAGAGAAMGAAAADLTQSGAIMGTVDYLAPEQALDTKRADQRADIYSLGCTLHFLLTGQATYSGDSLTSRLLAHRLNPLPSLRQARPDVPEALDEVFRRMIAKQPENRLASMTEVIVALEACAPLLENLGTAAPARPVARSEESATTFPNVGQTERRSTGRRDTAARKTAAYPAKAAADKAAGARRRSWRVLALAASLVLLVGVVVALSMRGGSGDLRPSEGTQSSTKLAKKKSPEAKPDQQERPKPIMPLVPIEPDKGDKKPMPFEESPLTHVRTFEGHTDQVWSVAFTPDGKRLLTGSKDKSMRLWDVDSGKELKRFDGHTNTVKSIAVSWDGQHVLTGGWDKTVRLWDLQNGKELHCFKGHTGAITMVAFSPDKKHAFSGAVDKTIRVWPLPDGEAVRVLKDSDEIHCFAFSGDGSRLATGGGNDPTIKLWDLENWNVLKSFTGHTRLIHNVALTRDGRLLLSGSTDRTTLAWNTLDGKERYSVECHSVCLSPDDKLALSDSMTDFAVILYDVESGRQLARSKGHKGEIPDRTFSADGNFAASASFDKTVRLWRLWKVSALDRQLKSP